MKTFNKPTWTCLKCGRIFAKVRQVHTCQRVPLSQHFNNKLIAQELFDYLVMRVNSKIGKCKIISLPCCIHLYGEYDFLAALPKKDRLEVRFALIRPLTSPRLKQSVPLSQKSFKHCLEIHIKDEIDDELIDWIKESYELK